MNSMAQINHGKNDSINKGSYAIIRGWNKLVLYKGYIDVEDQYELYDLVNDPEEIEKIYQSEVSMAKELRIALVEKLKLVNM